MRDDVGSLKFVLAGYGMPAEFAMHELFAFGVEPHQILLLTHASDARNIGLISQANLRGVAVCMDRPSSEAVIDRVLQHRPDIVMSMHYRSRIPGRILSAARLGTFNLHPSLLPRYRGTNSVPWAIVNGETKTGFSFHTMVEEFDAGRILLQKELEIGPRDTAFSIFNRQIVTALPWIGDVIRMVAAGEPGEIQQGESSYFPRGVPFGGNIDPDWDDEQVERFIRAMHFPPFEPARLVLRGAVHFIPTMDAYREITGGRGTS